MPPLAREIPRNDCGSKRLPKNLRGKPEQLVKRPACEQTKAAISSGFSRLRGKDSNLDYLIR